MTLLQNKKLRLNYEVLDTFHAGIELFGYEVKSLRNKHGSLDGSHITVRGGEAYIIGMHIPAYQVANTPKGYDDRRNRRLLLNRKELDKLSQSESKKGLTIAPISVYNNNRLIKLDIAIVRGKKKHDKRQDLKQRDDEREMRRTLKS
ncbi:SsrA-binding protein [Candidatus Wolfebacteria bacterium]|nr:MAG: SsrA-binding protein [Candidatus Wolfebacteria bacterium]